jgi:hypothetical protein
MSLPAASQFLKCGSTVHSDQGILSKSVPSRLTRSGLSANKSDFDSGLSCTANDSSLSCGSVIGTMIQGRPVCVESAEIGAVADSVTQRTVLLSGVAS